jgi:subtilase family serine protease
MSLARYVAIAASSLVCAVALCATGTAAMASTSAGLTLKPVAGTHPQWAQASALKGAASTAAAITPQIWLAGRDPSGEAAFASAVSTPGTAQYRHFLTPAQFAARFGATAAEESAVESWARSQGMTVTAANRDYVDVKTTVATAARAFSVAYGSYWVNGSVAGDLAAGQKTITVAAPEAAVRLPASVAPSVRTITGLSTAQEMVQPADSLPNPPQNRWNAGPCSNYTGANQANLEPAAYGKTAPWADCGLVPDQLRDAYGATQSGLTGAGQTIAIVDAYSSPTIVSDVNEYSTSHSNPGLATGQYSQVLPSSWDDVAECGGNSWYTEETIDTETVHGMAPGANIVYVGAADCNDSSFLSALQSIDNSHLASIVSNSWSAPEDQEATNLAAYDAIFEQGATEGIGFYFSTGDGGYNDPTTTEGQDAGSDQLQTSYPASSPWATGVGGTTLQLGSSFSYESETSYGEWRDELNSAGTGWTDPLPGTYPGDFYEGGGGGTSRYYSQPSYQAGVVPTSLSETQPNGTATSTPYRETPDVAMDASPLTGIQVGETTEQPNGSYAYAQSRWGGTSLACPLFAAMQAMAQQKLGGPIGFANPEIYQRYSEGLTQVVKPSSSPTFYALDWYTDPYTKETPILTYLSTEGIDGSGASLLSLRNGYSDATGTGSVNYAYLESF